MGFQKEWGLNRDRYSNIPLSIIGCGPSYDLENIRRIKTPIFAMNAAICEILKYKKHGDVWWFIMDLHSTFMNKSLREEYNERLNGWRWRIITKNKFKYVPDDADCWYFGWSKSHRRKFSPRGSLGKAIQIACCWGFRPIYLYGIDMKKGEDGQHYAKPF